MSRQLNEAVFWQDVGGAVAKGALGYIGGTIAEAMFQSFAHVKSSEQQMLESIRAMIEELKQFIREELRIAVQEHEFREIARDLALSKDCVRRFLVDKSLFSEELQKADDHANRSLEMIRQIGKSGMGLYLLAVNCRIAALTLQLKISEEKMSLSNYFVEFLKSVSDTLSNWDLDIYNSLNPDDRVSTVYEVGFVYGTDVTGDTIKVPLWGFDVDGRQHPDVQEGFKQASVDAEKERTEVYAALEEIFDDYSESSKVFEAAVEQWRSLARDLEHWKSTQ